MSSETAFQTQYRNEYIAAFERRQSLLREMVTTEAIIKGNQAVFLVAGSGGATAVTRGVNGLIPSRADANDQYTLTLTEWHDLVKKTGFNIFASQGDQRRLMQETTQAVINRKIDQQIITELETATQDTGAAAAGSLALVTYAITILANNNANGNVYAAITPAFYAYLLQSTEFASADYNTTRPLTDGVRARFRWAGVEFVVHTGLTGLATNAEKCIFWVKEAIGHAANSGGMMTPVGYDEEQDYTYARASMYMGAKLLQPNGVVIVNHDGSGFAAQ
jgi:hypothetical protein